MSCSLCGKCKKNNLSIGDCAVVPKFTWEPSPNGGYLRKTTLSEKIIKKGLTKVAIFATIFK